MKVRITNIQRFSLHDGPGIRTTIFLKGCNLKCPWCANPENINYEIEKYYDAEKEIFGVYGKDIDTDDLYKEIMKDKVFYNNEGGVTFSGGEPLLQIDNLEELLKRLKDENINICVETALFTSENAIKKAIKYVDEFIVDIKILDKDECKVVLNGNIEIFMNNIKLLFDNNCKVIYRIPLTYEHTAKEKNIDKILSLLKQYIPEKVQVFGIHSLAEKKYESLNRKMNYYKAISEEDMKDIINNIKKIGINVEENKI